MRGGLQETEKENSTVPVCLLIFKQRTSSIFYLIPAGLLQARKRSDESMSLSLLCPQSSYTRVVHND